MKFVSTACRPHDMIMYVPNWALIDTCTYGCMYWMWHKKSVVGGWTEQVRYVSSCARHVQWRPGQAHAPTRKVLDQLADYVEWYMHYVSGHTHRLSELTWRYSTFPMRVVNLRYLDTMMPVVMHVYRENTLWDMLLPTRRPPLLAWRLTC